MLIRAAYSTEVCFCNNHVREKDWRCHKCGTQATRACQSDLVGVADARQRQSFDRMHTLCFIRIGRTITPYAH